MRVSLLFMLAIIGCNKPKDEDGDGWTSDEDCNDSDPDINPDAEESCDGLDNDCDADVDEEGPWWYLDADGDSFGRDDESYNLQSCDQPAGFVDNPNDCDDLDALIYPETTWYADGDGDGYGDPESGETLCDQPSGTVDNDSDCDDTNADVNPESIWYVDGDNDGYGDPSSDPVAQCEQPDGYAPNPEDCDDDNADRNPETTWYSDGDLDGYGDPDTTLQGCLTPAGYVGNDEDCDDSSDENHPDADEICNDGFDNNCDGELGECILNVANAHVKISGQELQANAGHELLAPGDLDGDGDNDLVISARNDSVNGTETGRVFVMSGPFISGTDESLEDASVIINGSDSADFGSNIGIALAGEDLNGDGATDLVVAAHSYDTKKSGSTHVFYGPLSGEISIDDADAVLHGMKNFDRLSDGLRVLEDATGDSIPDLAITAPYAKNADSDANSGVVYLVSGPLPGSGFDADIEDAASHVFIGEAEYQLGRESASIDFDGDGTYDLGAASRFANDTGAVWVWLGGQAEGTYLTTDADAEFLGENEFDSLGISLDSAGDVNNDGLEDMIVGAADADPNGTSSGKVYIVLGGSNSGSLGSGETSFTGAHANDRIGMSVSTGDFDGDGEVDFLIGSLAAGSLDQGASYLFYGPVTGSLVVDTADAIIEGEEVDDSAGKAIFAGDLDASGDGTDDIAVGAEANDAGDSDSGAVYLIFGIEQ